MNGLRRDNWKSSVPDRLPMIILRWFVTNVMKLGLHILCRVDAPDINKIPAHGPLILYSNHTGSIEVPMLTGKSFRAHLQLAKVESWITGS